MINHISDRRGLSYDGPKKSNAGKGLPVWPTFCGMTAAATQAMGPFSQSLQGTNAGLMSCTTIKLM